MNKREHKKTKKKKKKKKKKKENLVKSVTILDQRERERSFKIQRNREHIPGLVFQTHSPNRPMVQKFPGERQNRKL